MSARETLSRKYFEDVYAANGDPWDFVRSEYERAKYRRTLATLDRERYAQALEIGCSVGEQTALLAERCEHLLAIDISQQAIERAKKRCAHLGNVQFSRLTVPEEYPAGPFHLTVLSEVGYYFAREDLARLADEIYAHAATNGELLLVHWLPFVEDYPLTGDEVHEFFRQRREWINVASARQEQYRIDLLMKREMAPE